MTKIWIEKPLYGGDSLLGQTNCRDTVKTIVGLCTGHCSLNTHRFRLRLAPSPACDYCGQEEETTVHFLLECPAFVRQRVVFLGEGIASHLTLKATHVNVLMAYINATGRFVKSLQ